MLCIWNKLLVFALLVIFFGTTYALEDDKKKLELTQEHIKKSENTTDYRLPDNVIPSEYFIRLTPYIIPNNFTFDGIVKILAKVKKETSKIVLHVDLMEIHDITILNINEENNTLSKLDVMNITRSEKYQFLNILMKSPISAHTNISIEISYTGILNTNMYGFFRNWYRINNEIRWVVGTQLQPTGARTIFPCFDEPALKAIFHISVVVPQNYSALSNMNIKSTPKNGVVEFESTPLMSTYLVAVVVSDFRSLSVKSRERLYSVWTNSDLIHQLPHSISVIGKMINFFENRLSLPYILPKLEMVALPDFSAVAMENWGLLIYSEIYMLYDVAVTPFGLKRYIRNLITHEIAHQWFGNLVTPKWWSYLWLNEAFAEYFEYHAHEDAINSWNLESQFVVNILHEAFSIDALISTHPVTYEVFSPDDIESVFDSITYNKGASLVRMLEKLLGPKMFFGALSRYLQRNQYSTVTPELLYLAIEEEIKANNYKLNATVTEIMNSWTLQSGFPVIDAQFIGDKITLRQRRFLLKPSENDTNDSFWIVPLNWATQSNPNFNDTRTVTWLKNNVTFITIENASMDWVIFNVQQTGFYRVNYDEKMWRRIINVLKSEKYEIIHEINRASLVDDLFNLGRASLLEYDMVLSASQYLVRETDYIPWKAAFRGLTYLSKRFIGHPDIYESFRIYITSMLEPHYRRLGFNEVTGEKDLDILLRELVLKWLCNFGYEECIKKSLKTFEKLQHNDSFIIAPNQQSFIYCTAVKHGSNQVWNYLWEKFEKSNYVTEKVIILSGLACSQNFTNLEKLLINVIIPESGIRKQNIKEIITYVADSSLIGVEATLNFIGANYSKMMDYIADDSTVQSIFSVVSELLSTEQLLAKFSNFIKTNSKNMTSISEFLESSLESSVYELNWYKNNAPKILKWLKTNYPSSKVN